MVHLARTTRPLPDFLADDLARTAVALGSDLAMTQGAGGNLSVKHDDVLWVKASGTRFAEAQRASIFLPVDLDAVRSIVLDSEDLGAAVLASETAAEGRPSIETAFHALMPHRFVLHVHSVGAIAASVGDLGRAQTDLSGIGDVRAVPYARPGLPLARELAAVGVAAMDAEEVAVVLLGNHGLLVAAPSLPECEEAVRRVERRMSVPFLHLLHEGEADPNGWRRTSRVGVLSAEARAVLLGGALTPDSAVFLGERPFSDRFGESPAVVDAEGSVWLRADLSQDAAQIALSLVGVALAAAPRGAARHLSASDVHVLHHWDAEAWRKEQER